MNLLTRAATARRSRRLEKRGMSLVLERTKRLSPKLSHLNARGVLRLRLVVDEELASFWNLIDIRDARFRAFLGTA